MLADVAFPQVVAMARYLGIDPEADEALMWIADEAIDAPVPSNWEALQDESGAPYYRSLDSQEVTRDNPADRFFMELFLMLKRHEVDSVIEARTLAAKLTGLDPTEMAVARRSQGLGVAEAVRSENLALRRQIRDLDKALEALR